MKIDTVLCIQDYGDLGTNIQSEPLNYLQSKNDNDLFIKTTLPAVPKDGDFILLPNDGNIIEQIKSKVKDQETINKMMKDYWRVEGTTFVAGNDNIFVDIRITNIILSPIKKTALD